MNHPVSVAVEPPRQPEIERLLEGSTTYAQSLGYPPEANFLLDLAQLERPDVRVYVARDDEGRALGIAALVDDVPVDAHDRADVVAERGELKRMFVDDSARGLGVAGRLLHAIETDASSRGLQQIVLETGTLHLPAQALYAKHGYRRIPAFGQYVGEPYSVCMAKDLGPPRVG